MIVHWPTYMQHGTAQLQGSDDADLIHTLCYSAHLKLQSARLMLQSAPIYWSNEAHHLLHLRSGSMRRPAHVASPTTDTTGAANGYAQPSAAE
jgi:hypothetical protein